jgi:hypothetical protein
MSQLITDLELSTLENFILMQFKASTKEEQQLPL